ncbi:hypothetical protein Tco_1033614 [Tanacetum coccineum]
MSESTVSASCRLMPKGKLQADDLATNILLQGLPKDIYSLINHYTDAKDIWDNVKMLLEGSELTKEDRESQLYDDFEHFRQHKGETIHDYYVRFAKLINDMRNIKMTMSRMQLNSKFVNNMLPEWGRFVTAVKLNRGLRDSNYDQLLWGSSEHELLNANLGQARQENGMALDEEQLLFITGGQDNDIDEDVFDDDVDEASVQDLKLNEYNVFQADQCDAFDSDVDEAPTTQTMFMANLSLVDPIYDEAGPSYDSDILSEVQDHDNYVDSVGEYHEVHKMQNDVQPNYVVDSDAEYMSDSDIILYEQYVKDNAVQVVQSNVSSVPNDALMMIINDMHEQSVQCVSANEQNKVVNESLTAELARYKEQVKLYEKGQVKTTHAPAIVHDLEDTLELAETTRMKMLEKSKSTLVMNDVNDVSIFSELHDAYTVEQAHCLELEAEISKLKHKIQKDDHSEMIKRFSNLEIDHLNLQLKYQNLKESFGNNKSQTSQDAPKFDTVFEIKKMKASLQGKDNVIRKLKEKISQMNERRSKADCIIEFKALDF